MLKVMILIPKNFKDKQGKEQVTSTDFVEKVETVLVKKFGGFSVQDVRGGYLRKDNGKIDYDSTIALITYISEKEQSARNYFTRLAKILAKKLNQETILIEYSQVEVIFQGA